MHPVFVCLSYQSESGALQLLISVPVQAGLNAPVPTLNLVEIQNILFFFWQVRTFLVNKNLHCHLQKHILSIIVIVLAFWNIFHSCIPSLFSWVNFPVACSNKCVSFLQTQIWFWFIVFLTKKKRCSHGYALISFYYFLFVFSEALWMTRCWCPSGLNGVPVAEKPTVVAPSAGCWWGQEYFCVWFYSPKF